MNVRREDVHCETDQDSRVVKVSLTFPKDRVQIEETPFGLVVSMEGATNAGIPGAPALPRVTVNVAVPDGMWPEPLRTRASKKKTLVKPRSLVAPIRPLRPGVGPDKDHVPADPCGEASPPRPPDPHDPRDLPEPFPPPPIVPPDPALYEQEVNDDRIARVVAVEQFGRSPVVTVEVRPVRLREDASLVLMERVELEIAYAPRPRKGVEPDELRRILADAGVDLQEIDMDRLRPLPEPVLTSPAQARRLGDIARDLVVNPELIPDWTVTLPDTDRPAEWLAITDNDLWDADSIAPTGPAGGDLVEEFERLAVHKRSRGLTARVVTVTDIVAGRYGDFVSGSRDLPEVIRRFLKSVHVRWGVAWLLVGGDVGIVPARHAATALEGHIDVGTDDPPEDNASFWTGSFLKMHVVKAGTWWPGSWPHLLVNPATGRLIPHDETGATASGGLGWYYTTGDDYATPTSTRTTYVRVNGPASVVNAKLQWLYEWNQVPTDFYYSSLQSWVLGHIDIDLWLATLRIPYVYEPEHDWDAVGNGLYGQYVGGKDVDGVHWRTDISVGRAPVQSGTEAATFVDKVIAYERFGARYRPSGTDWVSGVFIGASNWGGSVRITSTSTNPPEDNRFLAGSPRTIIKLKDAPGDFERQLIAEVSDSDRRELPWNTSTTAGARGWYYARSATDHSLNSVTFSILGISFEFPIPSQWIVVRGPAEERNPPSYLLDHTGADGSMRDQEELRGRLAVEQPQWNRVSRLYEDLTDLTPAEVAAAPVDYLTTARVEGALNAAPHIVSLSGHGSGNGCCGASTSMARGLTNGLPGFIAYADSCLTNQIDREDAFSEELLQNPDGGAVAYVGNTRFSWIGLGDDLQRAFFHRLTTTRHLGLLNDSRVTELNYAYWHAYARWVTFALTLTGDPEMPVWRYEPRRIFPEIDWKLDLRTPIEILIPTPFPDPPPFIVQVRQRRFARSLPVEAGRPTTIDVSDFEAGELTISVSAADPGIELVPYVRTVRARGPVWLTGTVSEVSHRHEGRERTEIVLTTGSARRRLRVQSKDSDYGILVTAAIEAHIAGTPIRLFVEADEDGADVLRLRLPG